MSKIDRWKIDFKLSKRKRESTRASERDQETISRRTTADNANLAEEGEANKRRRLNPEEMERAEQLQKSLREIGGQE